MIHKHHNGQWHMEGKSRSKISHFPHLSGCWDNQGIVRGENWLGIQDFENEYHTFSLTKVNEFTITVKN